MSNIQKEENFKKVLEIFFNEGENYFNIINFLENCDLDYSATDFSEELSKYQDNIERIFNVNIININVENLNYHIHQKNFNNIRNAIKIIKNLSATDFERLCALYLKLLGATHINTTPVSHDQGIDFVGIVDSKNNKFYTKYNDATNIYIIGQAKHYEDNKVISKEIRELAGSLYLLKSRNFALLKQPYKNLEIKAFTPIYAYYITSYYFTQSAIELCQNADIIPVDRILLSSTFGLDVLFQNNNVFDKNILYDKLDEIKTIY